MPDTEAPEPTERDMRALSRCWENFGWHAYMAGPCFDTYEQAVAYRDKLDAHGITWKSQDEPWPLPKEVRNA